MELVYFFLFQSYVIVHNVDGNMQPWWSLYLLAVFMLGLDSKLVGKYNYGRNETEVSYIMYVFQICLIVHPGWCNDIW